VGRKIPARLSPGVFERRLASGEVHAIARSLPADATGADLARALGMTPDALVCARIRLKARGVRVPSIDEMRKPTDADLHTYIADTARRLADQGTQALNDKPLTSAVSDQEPLGSSVSDQKPRWPSVEQFDREGGESPLPAIPDGHAVKGVSTLVGPDGAIKGQWIKTRSERDPIADIVAAFASIKDELPRCDGPIEAPAIHLERRRLSAYLYGDSHVGMHAWKGDAGSNFDLKIAEQNLTELTAKLVDLAPATERALLVNIGDYFHSDNRSNTTTKGTPVDVDGRWAKVLGVGIRIMRRNIDRALTKHKHVTVINEIGNHDTHTSLFLSLALAQFYESEPRVTIDTSPEFFHWFRFGRVLIMTHHGHLVKPQDLPGVMACDRAKDWGETTHRYALTGHIHHERSREFPGVFWRSIRASATSERGTMDRDTARRRS
jgi:hypothetical protein